MEPNAFRRTMRICTHPDPRKEKESNCPLFKRKMVIRILLTPRKVQKKRKGGFYWTLRWGW